MQPTSKLPATAVFKRIKPYCASQHDVPQFINELKGLLVQDFGSTFSVVKNRKLITQWKSLTTTSFVCSELGNWLLSAPLSGKRKAQFRSHLRVCEFIQAVFDEIDADAQKLGIWSSEPDAFLRAILGFVEYQSTAIDEKIPELDSGSSPQSLDAADKNVLRLRLSHDLIRDVSDGACIILAQFALRHLGACTGAPNEKEIREAFELAKRKDLIQQFFDNYSYLGWQAKIFGHTISFKAPHPDQLLLDYYRQQLITAGDQFDSVSEIALRMRLRRDKQHAAPTDFDGMPFAEFLECPDGKKILNNGEKVATELTKKIRKRILEVFEETAELHSSEGCYTIRELVDTWGFLSSFAYCAEQWTRSMIRRSRAEAFRTYAPIVKKDTLITLLSARLTISNQRADDLLRQFMIRDQNGGDWDLFYRPLVPLAGSDIGVASSFIGLSRFYRNVFSIAIRDTDTDLSARGFKPLSALREKFLSAGFRAGTNKAVCVGGREITDVDLFFLVDQVLFIAQVKVLLEPDSAHEKWKVMTKLSRAGEQLQRTMDNLPGLVGDLLDELGVPHEERKHIGQPFPFILCNIEHTTGFRLKGFPVVHFGLLEMLVRGGRIGMLAVEGGTVKHVGFRSVIRGSLPSGGDFVNLIQDPRPYFRAMFRPPTKFEQINFASGSFVIQAPGFYFTADNQAEEASSAGGTA